MTTMVDAALNTDGSWALVASAPIANILLTGVSNGWEIYVGSALPGVGVNGLSVSSVDGSWGSSSLDASDNVYGRPFGRLEGVAMSIRGMVN